MLLSIVIVNYNAAAWLPACLRSLEQATAGMATEVIVVDNASRDESVPLIRDQFPQVQLLAQAENTWFCGGNNIGIAAAQGEYVLLLNPDTVVRGDALQQMVTFLQTHPDYGGVTARLIYPAGNVQKTCSRLPTYADLLLNHSPLGWLFPAWKQRRNAHTWYSTWERDSDQDIEVAPGSCMLLRRTTAQLNDKLWLYFPEDDLAQRFKRPFRFLASAIIEHHEKSVTQNWRSTQVYFRDLLIYTREHHGTFAAGFLWLASRPLYGGMWLKQWFRAATHAR